MFEPQKFFIGLMDFFTILLPGGALVYLVSNLFLPGQSGDIGPGITETGRLLGSAEPVVVFLFASYLAGHVVFMIGANVLDDFVYEPLRKHARKRATKAKRPTRSLKKTCLRWIAAKVFPKRPDKALNHVLRIKSCTLAPLNADDAINAFQWSKARLSIDHPLGLAEVRRFEADSKFFRSFSIVLFLLAVMYFFTAHFLSSLACVPLFALAILRYIGQRFKSTEQAYRFIITLTAQPQIAEPTHAGGVVYRQETGTTTYLVTQARRNRDHWVLPKGHIEPCEDSRDTAVREVREETGFRVRVIRGLYDCRLGKGPESPLVRFYLMELIEGHWQEPDEGRESVWLEAADAIERLTAAESKGLLAYAEHLCRATPDR